MYQSKAWTAELEQIEQFRIREALRLFDTGMDGVLLFRAVYSRKHNNREGGCDLAEVLATTDRPDRYIVLTKLETPAPSGIKIGPRTYPIRTCGALNTLRFLVVNPCPEQQVLKVLKNKHSNF